MTKRLKFNNARSLCPFKVSINGFQLYLMIDYTSFKKRLSIINHPPIPTTSNEDHYEIACNNKVRIVLKKDKQKIVLTSYFYFLKQTEQSGSNFLPLNFQVEHGSR